MSSELDEIVKKIKAQGNIKLSKNYNTEPSVSELNRLAKDRLRLERFIVYNKHCKICFEEEINLVNSDLNCLVLEKLNVKIEGNCNTFVGKKCTVVFKLEEQDFNANTNEEMKNILNSFKKKIEIMKVLLFNFRESLMI
jgi:hypothetical protein